MAVNLEGYVLVNFLMNLMLIGLCARSVGRVRWTSLLFAAALGTLYAVAMYLSPFALLRHWLPKALLPALLSAIAMRADDVRDVARGAARLACCAIFAGGLMALASSLTGITGARLYLFAPLAGAAVAVLLRRREHRLERWDVRLVLRMGTARVRFRALVDTGNRLREPISGLPVLIVERDALRGVPMPERGVRYVGYGALGGSGRLPCFLPDRLLACVSGSWVRAPDVWVAVYPGHMPGGVKALAPPVLGRILPTEGAAEADEGGGSDRHAGG